MSGSTRIPVSLDVGKATAKLAQLHQEKKKAKKKVSFSARRSSQMALRAFSFVGAGSIAMSFQSTEPSGNVSIFGEALTPLYALVQQTADRALGQSAAAHRSAREQTKAAFALYVGRTGNMAGMRDFYNTVAKIQSDVESGRNILRRDPRFIGPGFKEVTEASVAGHVKLFLENLHASNAMRILMSGFDYVVEGIKAD